MLPVKVCGITRLEDALAAVEMGASAVGFVFWPASPRYLAPADARRIAAFLPPFVVTVGVFVNQSAVEIDRIARQVRLGAVQLHGDESAEQCRRFRRHVIKAVAVKGGRLTMDVEALPAGVTVLIDAHDPVKRGGTGVAADWRVARRLAARRRVILAGGLTPANVGRAIAEAGPYGVDVSSGVEVAPGVKDTERLRAFFTAVRRASEPRRRSG
jgi:phosphoribosylanthranilate isomerase